MFCGVQSLFLVSFCVFFFKQKTAYEMRISDWSSDVCSSDLIAEGGIAAGGKIGIADIAPADQGQPAIGDPGLVMHTAGERGGAQQHLEAAPQQEIGRASCRGSVCQYV